VGRTGRPGQVIEPKGRRPPFPQLRVENPARPLWQKARLRSASVSTAVLAVERETAEEPVPVALTG